jgi:hypothetical protein
MSHPRCPSFQVLDWQNLDAAAVLFLHTLLVDLIIQPADAAAVTKTFARLAGKEVRVTIDAVFLHPCADTDSSICCIRVFLLPLVGSVFVHHCVPTMVGNVHPTPSNPNPRSQDLQALVDGLAFFLQRHFEPALKRAQHGIDAQRAHDRIKLAKKAMTHVPIV